MRTAIRLRILACCVLAIATLSSGCGVYSLGGVNIPAAMKSITVQFFENTAPLVNPRLSSKFTEALKERIRNQTRLAILAPSAIADGNFEGTITDYSLTPTAVEGNNRAGLIRLTITIRVKYTNTLAPKDDFEQSFSRYTDFQPPATAAAEQANIDVVNKMLTEDIFNRAFANW